MMPKVYYLCRSDKDDGLVFAPELPKNYTSYGCMYFVCNEAILPQILEILTASGNNENFIQALQQSPSTYRIHLPDIVDIDLVAKAEELQYVGKTDEIKPTDKLWILLPIDDNTNGMKVAAYYGIYIYGFTPESARAPP